ncbi:CAP domain-containing protein [Desulfolithobacter sp.]
MHRPLILLLIAALLVSCQPPPQTGLRLAPESGPKQAPEPWSRVEQQIFTLVNLQRAMHNLPLLKPDPRLHRAARLHGREMTRHLTLTHRSRDGRDFDKRVAGQGYHWTRVGENVAMEKTADSQAILPFRVMFGTDNLNLIQTYCRKHGLPLPRQWQDVGRGWSDDDWDRWKQEHGGNGGWMGSPGHRRNILLPDFTDTGIGHISVSARDEAVYHYFTQDFATGDSQP